MNLTCLGKMAISQELFVLERCINLENVQKKEENVSGNRNILKKLRKVPATNLICLIVLKNTKITMASSECL